VDTHDVRLNHIVIDGNRAARAGSQTAQTCASGTNNRFGFNARAGNCANCSFVRSVSMNAVCGTGFERWGDGARVLSSEFRDNGANGTPYLWSDGLTLLQSDGAVVRNNVFSNYTDVDFISGGARNATFEHNRITHTTRSSFAGLMLDNFNGGTHGDFAGTTVTNNAIDCGGQLCDFGINLGPHAWYPSAAITGGAVRGNTVTNAKQGINVDGAGTAASPVRVSGNVVSGSPTGARFNCGTRSTSNVNYAPDAVIDREGDTTPVTNRTWHQCP
jgi:hypothetical protein